MNQGVSAAATAAGQLGANATSMYGAQASYKSSQDKIAADSDPMNVMLGAAVGYGMKKFA